MSAPGVDHCCVECGRCVIKADKPISVRMTAKCPRCDEIRELEPSRPVLTRRYQCRACDNEIQTVLPRHRMTYCAGCGREGTLEVIEEDVAEETQTAHQSQQEVPVPVSTPVQD